MKTILAVGGAGYIGSHVTACLLDRGHRVIVLDDLSNSSPLVLKAVERLCGRAPGFIHADMRDTATVARALDGETIDAVILLGGLKSVSESVRNPLDYFRTNVGGAADLLTLMRDRGVFNVIFSSSATVYAQAAEQPVTEASPLGAINPYGETKLTIERMLDWTAASDPRWRIISLRYFNPVGAHPSGEIGEHPMQPPTNLFPIIARTAAGLRDVVEVYGDDYPTPDGSGVRDYVHVMDLAQAHVAAVEALPRASAGENLKINIGTGSGVSVLDVLKLWEEAVGRPIPHRITGRRAGDLAICLADPSRAADFLGWRSTFNHRDMCRDHWNFQRLHPSGYAG